MATKPKLKVIKKNGISQVPQRNSTRPQFIQRPTLTRTADTVHGIYKPTQKDSIDDEAVTEQVHRLMYKISGGEGGGEPGDDIQNVGTTNDPGTHDDLYARDDHVHAYNPGGGEQEKPWNYHDLDRLLVEQNGTPVGTNNGRPSQRCVTVIEDDLFGKRIFTVWHDGGRPQEEVPIGTMYLTVEHIGITEPGTTVADALHQTTKYHTYTFQLVFNDGTIWDDEPTYNVIRPYPNDFCIVADAGDPNDPSFGGHPLFHIIFSGLDVEEEGSIQMIYDAYFQAESITPPAPNGGAAAQLALACECVNRNQMANPAFNPSACYQSHLTKGQGIVVVWCGQPDIGGLDYVFSNCFDPTQILGQRYNTALTGYNIAMASAPDTRGVSTQLPTVESNDLWTYCAYICGGALEFSKTVSTGVTPGGLWTNILTIANPGSPMNEAGYNGAECAPSMVILNDPDNDPARSIIVIITMNTLTGAMEGYYFSDNASDLGRLCGYYVNFKPSLITDTMGDSYDAETGILMGYQLGASKTTLGEEEDVILYIYKTMVAWNNQVSGGICAPFFVMQYRNFQLISEATATAWNNLLLRSDCYQINQDNCPSVFSPTVAYSNLYPVRPWKVINYPWYPVNVYSKLSTIFYSNPGGEDPLAVVMENIMIIKDIPPYTIGLYTAP